MIVELLDQPPEFKPVEIKITFESMDELDSLYCRLIIPPKIVRDALREYHNIKNDGNSLTTSASLIDTLNAIKRMAMNAYNLNKEDGD